MNFSKFQKLQLFLKYFFSIKNDYFLELYFRNDIKCLITSQLDLKMGKMLVPITFKCLNFKLVSSTLDMDF